VSCKTVVKTVNHKPRRQSVCATKLISSPVKFTTTGAASSAKISRGGVVYATAGPPHCSTKCDFWIRAWTPLVRSTTWDTT
jgi:hypothetical protein